MTDNYSDATLILVGHGSTLNADSAQPTYQHADALRKQGVFSHVIEAFWKQEPMLAGALRGAFTKRVFIVPLFISEGYFTEEVIPREFGFRQSEDPTFSRVQKRDDQLLFYCHPVGTHSSMTRVVLARAEDAAARYPFPRSPKPTETSLFIAGHGTGNNENSRKAIEDQVRLIRDSGKYSDVHAIFMEESPRIAECYELARQRNVIVVPFFISDGLHSFEDIPVMLGESETTVRKRLKDGQPTWRNPTEKKGKLVWYTQSVGNEPHLPDVILDRVREVAQVGGCNS